MNISVNIPQAPVPAGYHFRDVQLEMSLKPFWDTTPETQAAVCREIFLQWLPLCRYTDSISIMLWIGDGSEILEYAGDLDAEFEWGRYLGSANMIHTTLFSDTGDPGHSGYSGWIQGRDPEQKGVHLRSYLYRDEPAKFTFRWLCELVKTLKRVGHEITGKVILVGETFDIGPEFAVSRFKYKWHPEICGGGALFGGKFIRCDVLLKGDDRAYAGFPTGIPDSTTFGKFFGRQTHYFFQDFGFDFLWLSNGFGFALEPFALTGAIFDGREFHTETAEKTAKSILQFWSDFREESPGINVRTRGTNLATGIDLGSDASPWRKIYSEVPLIDAPVNSPWASLDGDVGLELAGWMSHIARLPRSGFRYRYYIHDAWWNNSPYLDRYQRSPFDIYLPLAVARLQGDGSVETPSDIAFLSIDDSGGKMPVVVPTEVTTHILHAREFSPDAPAPIVWVYPWDAYHDLLSGSVKNPGLPFFGDWFVRGLITHSVPVNMVADSVEILSLLKDSPTSLAGSILLAPVTPDEFGLNEKLLAYAEAGGQVVLYGPLIDSQILRDLLEICCEAPLDGDFELTGIGLEEIHTGGNAVRHLSMLSAGGWSEIGTRYQLASGTQGTYARAAASLREFSSGGKLGWVRGSLATREYNPDTKNKILGPRLNELPSDQFFPTEKLGRLLIAKMGLDIQIRKSSPNDADPMFCIHRHRNAFVFSGYQLNQTSSLAFKMELGAPLFTTQQNRIKDGATHYSGPTGWHQVCRSFVQQQEASVVESRILMGVQHGYTQRLLLSGLQNATVYFFPEPGTEEGLEILRAPKFPYFVGDFVKPKFIDHKLGRLVTVENVTGELLFSW